MQTYGYKRFMPLRYNAKCGSSTQVEIIFFIVVRTRVLPQIAAFPSPMNESKKTISLINSAPACTGARLQLQIDSLGNSHL